METLASLKAPLITSLKDGGEISGVCGDLAVTPTNTTTSVVNFDAVTEKFTAIEAQIAGIEGTLGSLSKIEFLTLTNTELEANIVNSLYGSAKITATTTPLKVYAIYLIPSSSASGVQTPWYLMLESPTNVTYFVGVLALQSGDFTYNVRRVNVTLGGGGITLPVGWSMKVGILDTTKIGGTNNKVVYITKSVPTATPFITPLAVATTAVYDTPQQFSSGAIGSATQMSVITNVMTATVGGSMPNFNPAKLWWNFSYGEYINEAILTDGFTRPMFTPTSTSAVYGQFAYQDLRDEPVLIDPAYSAQYSFRGFVGGTLNKLILCGYYL